MDIRATCILTAALAMSVSTVAAASAPYKINVILPLSGGIAFLGTAEQSSLKHLQSWLQKNHMSVGGRPVRFVFHDDQSSPQVAVQIASQLLSENPKVIIGPAIVAMCNATAPLMRDQTVMYCTSPGIYPKAGSYIFSSSVATYDLLKAQFQYFSAKGIDRIALITTTDGSGQDAQRNVRKLLKLPQFSKMKLVENESFNRGAISASAQIQRIKAANPQAIIAWTTGASIGTVFKAISNANVQVPVVTTDGNMTYAQMRAYKGFLPTTLYIPSPEWLPNQPVNALPQQKAAKNAFYAAFAKTGTTPDAAASFSWDPGVLVVSALRHIGPQATAAQIRNYISKMTNVGGVDGIYDFVKIPQRGLGSKSAYVTKWSRKQHTWIAVSQPGGNPLK